MLLPDWRRTSNETARSTVESSQAAEVLQPVFHPGHVAQVDGDSLAGRHDQIGEVLDLLDFSLGLDDDLAAVGLHTPARRLDVLLAQRVDHVLGRQGVGPQRVDAQPDPDLPLALADQTHAADARNALESAA